jgi:hypothetical protein
MLPDGIVYTVQSKVRMQLFDKKNNPVGKANTMVGTGILQVPAGLTMTLTDTSGSQIELKGLPVTQILAGDEIQLIRYNVTHMNEVIRDRIINNTGRLAQFQSQLNHQLNAVKTEINNVEELVVVQEKRTWIIYLTLSLLVMLITGLTAAAYYCSRRVRRMIDEAYAKVKEHDALPEKVMEHVRNQLAKMEGGFEKMKKHARGDTGKSSEDQDEMRRQAPWTTEIPRRERDRFLGFLKSKGEQRGRDSGEYMSARDRNEDSVLLEQPRREAPTRDFLALGAPPRTSAITYIPEQEAVRYQPTDILSPLGDPPISPYRISTLERTKNKGASHEDSPK